MILQKSKKAELIVALDVATLAEIRDVVDQLDDAVDIYKIGSQAFTACGPAAVRFVMARGKRVFLDLKFHDIPNTVASAVRSAVGLGTTLVQASHPENAQQPGTLLMYTVHTSGGDEMMKAAAETAAQCAVEQNVPAPLTVGVTVLTSQAKSNNIADLVLERAKLAKKAGLNGIVASCHEAALIRKMLGPEFVIVTPGIRPAGADVGDQKRVATPAAAVNNGSDYLVVGRPIIQAPDPRKAARDILQEMNDA
ncbi:MAG: orotidine-5'-phosphate decarboxylase [Candidatus Omnitrophota bacterium]